MLEHIFMVTGQKQCMLHFLQYSFFLKIAKWILHYIIKVLDSDAVHCDCTFTLPVLTLRNYKILQRNFSKILYQKHRYKLFCRTSKLIASKQASNNHVITFCAYTKAIDTVNKLFICPDCSLFFFLFYALFFYLLIFFLWLRVSRYIYLWPIPSEKDLHTVNTKKYFFLNLKRI